MTDSIPEKLPDTDPKWVPFWMPLNPGHMDSEWDNLPIQNNPPSNPKEE